MVNWINYLCFDEKDNNNDKTKWFDKIIQGEDFV